MKSKIILINSIVFISIAIFFACNSTSTSNSNLKKAQGVNVSHIESITPKSGFQTNQLSNDEIKSIFTLAIKDFIETVFKKDKIQFDTLYFGKHVYGQADDFPNIELPIAIANTQIRLISPEEEFKCNKPIKT
jgi:hypothetical protein